ncbi:HAD family hydrolase [Desulforhopalus singaporensis]|uniref:phosphoglycolate phosphatase n=1 Tax=Desulforhopalus singaporensis TaxID=91360 RepID=A0A1H0J4X4_9BACT|nr:HAD hydrolase-like protein [Desulforhopalus singaporensis]SDO38756.1 Phosphoglycolate phosphatase, HAD superfamily [Desulforhopalus singaporensis]
MKNKRLEAIFFDFDGVIVDSTAIKTEAFRTLFGAYDNETVEKVLHHHRLHGGISRIDKIAYAHSEIIGKPLTRPEVDRWAADYSGLVVERVIATSLVAGVEQFFQKRPGHLKIFLVSGTPEQELKHIVDKRNLAGFFDQILGSPTKKPVHIRHLLQRYDLDCSRCVFVGDATTDYEASRETGLDFIGIQSDVDFPPGTVVLPDCSLLYDTIDSNYQW